MKGIHFPESTDPWFILELILTKCELVSFIVRQ